MIRSIVLLLIAALTLTGCLDYESRIKVRPDGSGVLIETLKFNEETADMVRSFAGEQTEQTDPAEEVFDEEELREKAKQYGEGVSYVSGKKIQDNGKIGYVAVYAFTNVEKLMLGQKNMTQQLPGGDEVDNPSINDESPADRFSFAFTPGDPSTLRIRVFPEGTLEEGLDEYQAKDQEEGESISDSLQDSYLRMMKIFLEGMRMNFVVEPEGKIVETNAHYRDSSAITIFGIDIDKLLADDKALKNLMAKGQEAGKPESMEDIKKLIRGIPGFTVEFDEVVIKFKE